MLARYGATVDCVNGGPEAIAAVKSRPEDHQYDLVLMDIQMPKVLSFMCPADFYSLHNTLV